MNEHTTIGNNAQSVSPDDVSESGVARRGHSRAASAGAADSPTCNTGGQNPELGINLLSHGIDTAYWSIPTGEIGESALLQLCQWCESVSMGGQNPESMPEGLRVEARGSMLGYQYTIIYPDGLRVAVPSESGLHMGLYAMAGSAWCLGHVPQAYETDIEAALLQLGVSVPAAAIRLSRADVRFDLQGLCPGVEPGQIVTRAKQYNLHYAGDDFTGISAGKGDVRLRLYDKTLEALEAGTIDRWLDAWGIDAAELQGRVWRLEYQMRGKFLRQFHVENMGQFLKCLGDIVGYLMGWFRVAHVQARKDVERPLVDWWQGIVDVVQSIPLGAIGAVRDVLPKLPKPGELWLQLRGLTAAWWAARVACGESHEVFSLSAMSNAIRHALAADGEVVRDKYGGKLQAYRLAQFA